MEKINLNSFEKNTLLAKLLTIKRDFIRNNILEQGKDEVIKFSSNAIETNFIYPNEKFQALRDHLALFLLDNNDNIFSKTINK